MGEGVSMSYSNYDLSSSDMNFYLVTVNLFLWRKIYSCECDGKFIPITGIVIVSQEIFSFGRKFLPAVQNLLLWHKIPYFDRIFLLASIFFPVTVMFFLFSFRLNTAKFLATKCGNFSKDFVWGPNISWEPGSQVPCENPTLPCTKP